MHLVITENDVSAWADITGKEYHFPKKYKSFLVSGVKVIYYKGRIKDRYFADSRLSNHPHYFGIATVDEVRPDTASDKGDLYAFLKDYQPFEQAVLAKLGSGYFEDIPESKASNYWRDAVRVIDEKSYSAILNSAVFQQPQDPSFDDGESGAVLGEFESREEGKPSKVYSTRYERDPKLRQQAIEIHGVTCKGCGFNFEKEYGEYAKGIVHVHHVVPVSEYDNGRLVNPRLDLVPLCPNCHAVVHRKKGSTLSLEELRALVARLYKQ
ncbi:HNH endonuclease [Pseudomonas nitroreducens]|uniref:HNH endonuclease n=1 Tax=Pseudomonas nitroreducens TaxID=46680 RepID=UPI0023F949B8|nr:HNH endonuclease [Pseudomonas nitroreducens]WEW97830.1 HNH endonuclease [Pseudomonas nitroreducens]